LRSGTKDCRRVETDLSLIAKGIYNSERRAIGGAFDQPAVVGRKNHGGFVMASAGGSRFYRYVAPRRQADTGSDVERGLQVGEQFGKLLGGLGDAIKQQKMNAVANQLIDTQAIGNQPGAGAKQDLGTLPADTGAAPDDSWTLPQDTSHDFSGSGTVGGSFSPDSGPGTVGSLIHTDGVDELKLRQEVAKSQLEQQNIQAQIARRNAKKEFEAQQEVDDQLKESESVVDSSTDEKPATEEPSASTASTGYSDWRNWPKTEPTGANLPRLFSAAAQVASLRPRQGRPETDQPNPASFPTVCLLA
jgi:hypothetical protein